MLPASDLIEIGGLDFHQTSKFASRSDSEGLTAINGEVLMSSGSVFDLRAEICWPTILFHRQWQDHSRESPGIIELLYQIRAEQSTNMTKHVAARAKARDGIYESNFNLFTNPHPGLQKLVQFIGHSLGGAVSHADGGRVQPSQLDMTVVESWFHIANDGGYHDAHHHPNCSWCGIYYLQIGASESLLQGGAPNGGSRFYSPIKAGYRDSGNRYLMEELDAPLQDGLLILFPSYLQHAGLPYRGEKDRIVIAFNSRIFLKGEPSSFRP